jgi:hypothetical protein
MAVGLTLVLVSLSTATVAQRGTRGAPARYDTTTEVTLDGVIAAVTETTAPRRGRGGLHLTVTGGSRTFEVHVGPAEFVASKSFTFAAGEAISVTGSTITLDGSTVVLAREIKKGDRILALRDAKGFPLWSRRMRS